MQRLHHTYTHKTVRIHLNERFEKKNPVTQKTPRSFSSTKNEVQKNVFTPAIVDSFIFFIILISHRIKKCLANKEETNHQTTLFSNAVI